MPPSTLRATLETLGWRAPYLARLLGVPDKTPTNWLLGRYQMPPDAAAWLARRLDDHHRAMRDDPPPATTNGRR
jgi:plasmid maintenance system antidote protein VapI